MFKNIYRSTDARSPIDFDRSLNTEKSLETLLTMNNNSQSQNKTIVVPFAGANNKYSQFKFTNRNDIIPYSEATPSYLRLNEKDSK